MRSALTSLALTALIAALATGCGGGDTKKSTSSSSGTPQSSGVHAHTGPLLPTLPAKEGDETKTCATVSYKITSAGAEIDAKVAGTPARISFEADDKDDNPVAGTEPVEYAFNGSETRHTVVIKGAKSVDHVSVTAIGTSQDDSCWATNG